MVMKTLSRYLILGSAAILSAACISEKEYEHSSGALENIVFSACYAPSTKTILAEDNEIHWLPGDRIAVSGATEPFVSSAQEQEARTSFSGMTASASEYYAVYPYELFDSWNGSVATVELPKNQEAVIGTFANCLNISVAGTDAVEKDLKFRNVLGYVKFTVTKASGTVRSITVTSNGGEALAGSVKIDCAADIPVVSTTDTSYPSVTLSAADSFVAGDYYVAVLPGIYEDGLSFIFTDAEGNESVYVFNQRLEVKSGTIKNVGVVKNLRSEIAKKFSHRSLAMRFTADWCPYCPLMNTSLLEAQKASEGKLEIASFYASTCYSSVLGFSDSYFYETYFNIEGYPTAVIDARADVPNYSPTSFMSDLVNALAVETETSYPTKTGLSIATSLSGSTLTADVKVYVKEADEYTVTAFLVEDNIISYQADAYAGNSQEYEHDNVVRKAVTDVLGESFEATTDAFVWQKRYTVEIPSDSNPANLSLLVCVSKPYGKQDKVKNYANYVSYGDYGETYIDNCLSAKIGTDVGLQFAE